LQVFSCFARIAVTGSLLRLKRGLTWGAPQSGLCPSARQQGRLKRRNICQTSAPSQGHMEMQRDWLNAKEAEVQISNGWKTPLLIAAVFVIMAIGKSAAVERNHQAPPPSLAYGGHNFDRPPNDVQGERYATTVAFMGSSGARLERRRQLRFRIAQAAALRSAVPSGQGSCGRGRYRDSTNGKCRGPADILPHP
jgi:hypothetical protein